MENTMILQVNNLCKNYSQFALQNVSFSLPKGSIMGLIGENGAGKSTTMRLILGLCKPDSGSVSVFGHEGVTAADREQIGVVFDELPFNQTIFTSHLGKVMAGIYQNWDMELYQQYLKRFALPDKKELKEFSRGMKMKLSIAAALSHRPRLLLLDEPTSGLDPIVRDEVLEIFNEFTREEDHSILISSHILSDLEKLCDYIAFLHQGRLLFCDEKDRLLEEYGIFVGTADQVNSLQDGAVVARENSSFGGVRCLVKRALVPAGWALERPTVEDIVLFLVKGAKEQ